MSEAEQEWIKQHPVVRVSFDPRYAPVEFIDDDGQFKGLSADYLKQLAQLTGLQFEVVPYANWSEALNAIKNREIDLLPAVRKTASRSDFMLFSQPYNNQSLAIISATDDNNDSIDDFSNKKVAVIQDYFWNELLPERHPDIILESYPTLADGLQAVAFGQADAMFTTLSTATYYLQEKGITRLKVKGTTPYNTEYGLGSRSDWPELASILDKALAEISPEQREALYQNWVHLERDDVELLRDTQRVLVVTIFILGMLWLLQRLWIHSLRNTVRQRTRQLEALTLNLEETIHERTQALSEANDTLQALAYTDSVTRIKNRRSLDERLQWLAEYQADTIIGFILIDIDLFKLYNDYYGHDEGDRCLRRVGQFLEQQVAETKDGLAARYGGEEFAIVLPGHSLEQANRFARQLKLALSQLRIPHAASEVASYVTFSQGVSALALSERGHIRDLVRQADSALYEAKKKGRNQIDVFRWESVDAAKAEEK